MRGLQRAQIGPVIWRVLAFSIVGCVAVLLLLTSGAFAGESGSRKNPALPVALELQATALARPTDAWSDFCQRLPTECNINLSEPEKMKLTRATWNTIKAINTRINGSIIPLSDQDHWGVADRWDLPDDGYGDCEDIQLLKRKLLVERGLPRRAMRMTVAIDDRGEGHAVLMMRTDRGDFILDNKTDAILPWHKTGLTFSKREGHDSTAWVSLGGIASPIATANR
jgi:predicted transglutaminase-like cysteine proteinase